MISAGVSFIARVGQIFFRPRTGTIMMTFAFTNKYLLAENDEVLKTEAGGNLFT